MYQVRDVLLLQGESGDYIPLAGTIVQIPSFPPPSTAQAECGPGQSYGFSNAVGANSVTSLGTIEYTIPVGTSGPIEFG